MGDLCRWVWREPRPANAPPASWRDFVLIGLIVIAAVVEGLLRPDLPMRQLAVAVVAGMALTLLWRRTRPLAMVVVAYSGSLLLAVPPGPQPEMYTMAYLLLMPYSLARWASGRAAAAGLALMLTGTGVSAATGRTSLVDTLGGLIVMVCLLTLGIAMRLRAAARARELERVKLQERERLARDLHDTVAHHVSAMAIRAQAGLATAAADPRASIEALRIIQDEAAAALVDLRAMVRVLRRDEPVSLSPQPGLADLSRLAAQPPHGPAVEVDVGVGLESVAPSVATAIYRLAQESVTNARRHARHATRIVVSVTMDKTLVHLRVSDDGDTAADRAPHAPGFGLAGMMERADLLGGVCKAGPDPGRGWTVTASLPRSGAPA